MQIQFERTGGFAGLRLKFATDTASLPEEEARVLRDEVDDACFFDLPARIQDAEAGPDRFEYQLSIRDGDRQHTVTVGDAALDDNLLPLVQHLEILARTPRI